MKTMTCQQLGGPCDHQFKGETADESSRPRTATSPPATPATKRPITKWGAVGAGDG